MSSVKEKKNLLTNFHESKKGKTPDKVSCVKESVMSKKKKTLLTKWYASIIYKTER